MSFGASTSEQVTTFGGWWFVHFGSVATLFLNFPDRKLLLSIIACVVLTNTSAAVPLSFLFSNLELTQEAGHLQSL